MSQTKKLLVDFDPDRPDQTSSDFLVPILYNGRFVLYGLKSGRHRRFGVVIYLGREIDEEDLLSKLVDSGQKVANADETTKTLRRYIEQLQPLRIGNVVRLPECTGCIFELELLAKTPSGFRR
jgi:hypothetical protein